MLATEIIRQLANKSPKIRVSLTKIQRSYKFGPSEQKNELNNIFKPCIDMDKKKIKFKSN